jgi:uncharacterized protein YjbI with pentapeptide repeats
MSPEVTAAIIAASVGVLTLIGTLAAQIYGRRATSRDTQQALKEQGKQLDRTLAEQRTRTLNERFATAAEQLGSDKPAVRLAGVYAMSGLADDWPENRQTCVDVLCAYLRLPYEPDPGDEASADKQLDFHGGSEDRHTVIRVITAHLKADAAVSWQGLNFDFTGAVFDGGDFTDAKFTGGKVNFADAKFTGSKVRFTRAEFSGGEVSFLGAVFSGSTVDFIGARFSGGKVFFTQAKFSGGEVNFRFAQFTGGTVDFTDAGFTGSEVSFGGIDFSGSRVSFIGAQFTGGTVDFSIAEFSGGEARFLGAKFSGGEVNFRYAKFTGGTVDFARAEFTGGTVDFARAEFTGGTIDFSDARDWSFPPEFPWTDTPPSGVKLPGTKDRSQA